MNTRQRFRQNVRKGKGETSPRLSVILCTYNRRNLVLSTLASLRRQTLPYNEFEVLVIDNGSTDGTLNAVRAYVGAGMQQYKKPEDMWRVQCLYEPQHGLAYARNTGLLAASGEIAVFLDDDAMADPYFLERLLAAYDETHADAVGGRVELSWEVPRPHWLADDLLELLGYYAPATTRTQLKPFASFSSTNFSVRVEALRTIGCFSPFLSKKQHQPVSTEVFDLCCRLHAAGYALWYEPAAVVRHRVPAARLIRPFFVGRAYWQARSEVLAQYVGTKHTGGKPSYSTAFLLRAVLQELGEILHLFLIHRPLLRLAGKPSSERLAAAMSQARSWGRLQQYLQLLEHAPIDLTTAAVLLVRDVEPDLTADLLVQALNSYQGNGRGEGRAEPGGPSPRHYISQDVYCSVSITDVPLSWLWHHRALHVQATGILHFYRPGAFHLTLRQRQRLRFRLWLAQHWRIPVVVTDAGGWWQGNRSLRFLSRRMLERTLMNRSALILGYTRLPEQLYPNKRIRRRVRCLPHPGFRGYYPAPLARAQARAQLGLPANARFVYLCFASAHTEQELLFLLDAFREMIKHQVRQEALQKEMPQLLLIGTPQDKKVATRVLGQAARIPAVHLSMADVRQEDIPLYLGAGNALVMPHFAVQTAGMLETALLGLSYELVVVAPNLPRFRGMLPPRASVLYTPGSRDALRDALLKAQTLAYSLTKQEAAALDAQSGWSQYAYRLAKMYFEILGRT